MCICVHLCINVSVCIYIYVCLCVSVCIHVYVCLSMCVGLPVCLCQCVCCPFVLCLCLVCLGLCVYGEAKRTACGWMALEVRKAPQGSKFSCFTDRVSGLSRSESSGLHNTTSRPNGGGMKKKLKLICWLKQTCALLLYLLQNSEPNPIQPFSSGPAFMRTVGSLKLLPNQ